MMVMKSQVLYGFKAGMMGWSENEEEIITNPKAKQVKIQHVLVAFVILVIFMIEIYVNL